MTLGSTALVRINLAAALMLMSGVAGWGLDWSSGPHYRSAALLPAGGPAGFALLSPSVTGVTFTNLLPQARHLTNQVLMNGSGIAAGDVDGDGWCDLYLCALSGPNKLFRNLGQWKFEDITSTSGTACPELDATGAALVDLDGDGDLDLLVNSVGQGTHVFYNDGRARFARAAFVLNPRRGGTSLALGDFDGDSFLDLYIANYRPSGLMDMPNAYFQFKTVNGRRVITTVNNRPITDPEFADRFVVNERGGIDEVGEPDALYRNVGGTNFLHVPYTSGAFLDEEGRPLTAPLFDWGLSVAFRDLNQDGLPDLYICNDFDSPERVWINQGAGRLRAVPRLAFRKTCLFSMGADFADFNRDGLDDIFAVDMLTRNHIQQMDTQPDRKSGVEPATRSDRRPQYSMNTLFLNRGDGSYAEIAQLAEVAASEWSWAVVFLDVDLDGWEDILVSNGHEREARSLDITHQLRTLRAQQKLSPAEILASRKISPRLENANLAFRNRADLTFEDASRKWGFDWKGVSHGMALADLDNDGDLDVVVNNLNAPAGLYRNETVAPRVAVRLKGKAPNTHGIGARITVFAGAVPAQSQEMMSGGRYVSGDDAVRTFAAGNLTNDMRVEVAWRSGARSVVTGVKANHIYEIDESEAASVTNASRSNASTLQPFNAVTFFQDVSSLLNHIHHDDAFDDYERQPLLPNKLSQLGPGAAWFDLEDDGWDDLVVGTGKGGFLTGFRNDGRGGFKRMSDPPFNRPITRDQTSVLGWRHAPGQTVVLAGSANYEDGLIAGSAVRQFELGNPSIDDSLPGRESATGPLAMADVDGDGDLDLFVGGRCLPGKFPRPASSALFRNTNGKLELAADNVRPLEGVGLVSGAVFSDLDADGDPDLVLACEWGPLKIFRNDTGRFSSWNWPVILDDSSLLTPHSSRSTLAMLTGWWTGVSAGDFDGDGRFDLVAGNWGQNTPYQSHRTRPLRLYYGDVDGNNTEDLLEAYYDSALNKIVPERPLDFISKAMPWLRPRFASHKAYGSASVEEILGESLRQAKVHEAAWLESTVFLNRADHWEAHQLPVEAQAAPAFAVCIGDMDGDGAEDVFLSQNFFATQSHTPRYDAGQGLWLQGDGRGRFTAVPVRRSGVRVDGEQRGAALADYDADGRVDLLVTQNSEATKLYRNVGAKPGLRVRLEGPPGNPAGIGGAMRLGEESRMGPAREIHAGSGYWSQDSPVQVLHAASASRQLWVRWPGGKVTEVAVPGGAKEVSIDANGKLTVVRQ